MRAFFAGLGGAGLVLVTGIAAADPTPTAAPAGPAGALVTDDCAKARNAGKTCVLEVPPEPVAGATPTATDAGLRVLWFHTSGSLIRLRRDFVPEIVQAADDL
jgi:hypothetical protein